MSLTQRERAVLRNLPAPARKDDSIVEKLIARLRGFGVNGRGPVSGGRGLTAGDLLNWSHAYPIGAGGGTTITDEEGSNDGTINDATWISDASLVNGYGLNFDGSNDYVSFASTLSHIAGGSNPFTFAITYRTSDTAQSNKTMVTHTTDSNDLFSISMQGGVVRVGRFGNSNWQETKSGSVNADTLTRIFWSYDGSSSRLWLNGSEVTGTSEPSGSLSTAGFRLGADTSGSRYQKGDLDAFNVALYAGDAQDAQADYNNQPWT